MSEISLISNQYQTVVETTERVNDSIISLKKDSIIHSKKNNIEFHFSQEEAESAKKYLIDFLEFLKKMNSNLVESNYLPEIVIKDFQKRLINSIPFFEDEVKEIIKVLTSGKHLEKVQFNLLDKMASTLDNERTVLFKKLRSARG